MGTAVRLSSMTSHHQARFVSSYICSKLTKSGKVWKQIRSFNSFCLPKKLREDFPLNHINTAFSITQGMLHMYTSLPKIRGLMSEES